MVVIYIYSIIGFLFYRDHLVIDGLNICENMLECFVQFVNFGLRNGGGIGDVMTSSDWHENNAIFRILYDSSFFFIVIIILMNIIFGIIIDTFGELREEAEKIQEDIENFCFICGLERREFDRLSKAGFEYHQNVEHNLWNYLAFYMHLKKKEKTEYTGPEQYVMDMIQSKNYKFVPTLCALSIVQPTVTEEETYNISTIYSKVIEFSEMSISLDENMQKVSNRLDALETLTKCKSKSEEAWSQRAKEAEQNLDYQSMKTSQKLSHILSQISTIKASLRS